MQPMHIHNLTQAQAPDQLPTIDPIAFTNCKQTVQGVHVREAWYIYMGHAVMLDFDVCIV